MFFKLRELRGDSGHQAAAEVPGGPRQDGEEETRRGGEGTFAASCQVQVRERSENGDDIELRRTKTDDPEREKLKAKAKEIQRDEAERIRWVALSCHVVSLGLFLMMHIPDTRKQTELLSRPSEDQRKGNSVR